MPHEAKIAPSIHGVSFYRVHRSPWGKPRRLPSRHFILPSRPLRSRFQAANAACRRASSAHLSGAKATTVKGLFQPPIRYHADAVHRNMVRRLLQWRSGNTMKNTIDDAGGVVIEYKIIKQN
jgi:hypothetical protein